MHVGIDVGGTNTDAVLLEDDRVLASVKRPTSADVTSGVRDALAAVLDEAGVSPGALRAVAIGTTHFTNAVVQAKELARTAVVRLCLPASTGVPPLVAWPDALVEAIGRHTFLCHGGQEFDGREISALDEDELRHVGAELDAAGIEAVAITSIFSPVSAEMEQRAAAVLTEGRPHLLVSLSHEIGRIGLLERENANVVNACLLPVAARTTTAFTDALAALDITAPLYLSQNDGTLMDVDFVRRYPVATFAAGPTNSMRGAARLSGLADCIVVDVGGTTTDVGAVVGGFPRGATTDVDIAGVRTNFRMPDVVSIGIGGGSLVSDDGATVGPASVGHRLTTEALVFGGSTLTATDVAVAAGLVHLGDPSRVAHLDPAVVRRALDSIAERIGALAESMRTSRDPVPLVLVGGGSVLLPERIPGFETVVKPERFDVANAIGAAIAQVGGEVDRIVSTEQGTREQLLADARAEAVDKAVQAGAAPDSVDVVEVDELPIAYLPGNATRLRVRAVGDLVFGGK